MMFPGFFLRVLGIILTLLPHLVSSSSLGPLTRRVGEHVVFMFNSSTNILEVLWGIRDGDTINLKLGLITVDTLSGVQPNPNLPSTSYAGRVSFVGNLTKGQAWFKITNLNISDSNQYMAKIRVNGASGYDNIPVMLTVIEPAAISNLISIIGAKGEDVVFTFNTSTYIQEVLWGLRDGETSNLKLPLMSGLLSSGVKLNPNMPQHYAGRVSFVGNLTKGEAWFKITNLNMNDSNEYMAKIKAKDTTNYENIPLKLIVILPATVPTTMHLLTSTKASTWITEGLTTTFQTTTSSEPTTVIFSKDQSSSDSTCTPIIAASVTINVVLVLVVVFLAVYIWRGKSNKARTAQRRRSSKIVKEEAEVYENPHQIESTSLSVSSHVSGKEFYETIKENRGESGNTHHAHSGHSETKVKTSRRPPSNIQDPLSSLPQHYQELRRETPQPIPLYEPLDQKTDDTKTYEQLQQNKQGREYQSLKKYTNVESKV